MPGGEKKVYSGRGPGTFISGCEQYAGGWRRGGAMDILPDMAVTAHGSFNLYGRRKGSRDHGPLLPEEPWADQRGGVPTLAQWPMRAAATSRHAGL